jgi:serralysin
VAVALADINGDGVADLVVATGQGATHVKAFDGVSGAQIHSVQPFGGFGGGLSLAVGDIDGDGLADIVIGTLTGATHVKALSGLTGQELASFFAFEGFAGGVRVAAGDTDGDGLADIAAVAGPGGNGHIKVFSGRGLGLLQSFLGYVGFAGEISLAMARVDQSGLDRVMTAAVNPVLGVHVKAFGEAGELRSAVSPAPAPASGPVRLGVAELTGDGIDELIFSNVSLRVQDGATLLMLDAPFVLDPVFVRGSLLASA